MTLAPPQDDEARRLASLAELDILDTPSEAGFDALVQAAALICGVSISLIGLIDAEREWFKASLGLPGVTEVPRALTFCTHAILSDDLLEVPDATQDVRFADHPAVAADAGLRFYAAAPLCLDDGSRVGALCVADHQPRRLDDVQRAVLRKLAQATTALLQERRTRRKLREATRDLQASETRQRLLYEAAPAMLKYVDADNRLVAASTMWLERLGYTREEAIGRPIHDFLTPESDRKGRTTGRPALFRTGRCDKVEMQFIAKDGEIIDALYSAVLEGEPDGQPQPRLAAIEDVTQRRRAEAALQAERRRFADIIDGAELGSFEWNLQTNEIRVNERWANMLGYTLAELQPVSIATRRDRMHPADVAGFDAAIHRHRTGESEVYEYESRMRHRNGRWVWVSSRGKIMEWTAEGRPLWMFGTVKDITERRHQEDALRKSMDLLASIGEAAGVGGWEMNLQSGEVFWTRETYRIFGLPPDCRPTLDAAVDLHPPQARPVIRAAVSGAMVKGAVWDLELPLVRATGERIWVRSVGRVIEDDGEPMRLNVAIQDITTRITERQALEHARERMALAAESAGLGVWDWDVRTDAQVWDSSMYRMYGRPTGRGAPSHAAWRAYVHPEDLVATEAAIAESLRGGTPFDAEFRIRHGDGGIRHIRAASHVIRDQQQRPLRMVGINWDVTEARLLAAERDAQADRLAESEASFRMLAENASEMISRVAADGTRLYVSPSVQRIFGVSTEDFLHDSTRYFHPDDAATARAWRHELLSGVARTTIRPLRVVNPERGDVWIEVSVRMLRDAGGVPAGYISITRDITERVRHEAEQETRLHELNAANATLERLARHLARARAIAEQANTAKTRFLAGMSHELRTPLNGILGYAQLLRLDGSLTAQQSERVHAMMTAGTHLLEMIHNVLDLSEIETGRGTLEISDVDLRQLGRDKLDTVRPAAAAKGLALDLVVAPEVPRLVSLDAQRLRQSLLNLLGNAIKFTASGRITLRVGLAATPARLRFEVADTGPGIPADKRDRLFREFDRLDADAAKQVEGSGLGLSLAAGFAKLMGGALGYDDNPGGGSLFWLELPLVEAVVLPVAADPQPVAADTLPASDTALPILIVDDNPMNRDIAAAFLASAGYDTVLADSGEAALATAAVGDFLAILMDVRMPGIDGLEATRRLRALPGASGATPVVALTAQAFADEIEACRLAGMDTHVLKPFTLESLLAGIERAVAIARPRAHAAATAPASPLGADQPVLDAAVLDRTATLLQPAAVRDFMRTLTVRSEALRHELAARDRIASKAEALAHAAHVLAGSAGMFGFERLVFVARHFERAISHDPPQAIVLADTLDDALEVSLHHMRDLADGPLAAMQGADASD